MITDIAQRAASRDPMVSFRRTDTDRRPARRVVMPNDGPAPDRLAQAEARREALRRKVVQAPKEHHMTRTEGFERSVAATLQAIADGKHILPEIAPLIGVGPERTRDFAYALVARGLAWKQLERREKNRSYSAFHLTEAGKVQVAGGGDAER
jgi:hypothetical protein